MNSLRAMRPLARCHGSTAPSHPAPISARIHSRPLLRRTITSAPGPHSGPLMSRRADRELPSIKSNRKWIRTLPIFAVIVGASMLGIFNYQKSSSSVVNSTLYALRTSPKGREVLGDEIYFAEKIPWISGEMNQLHGRIDITFWVKGTKGRGEMRFRSIRDGRMGYFRTEVWSLTMEDGTVIQLLDAARGDPFQASMSNDMASELQTSV
ncbi:hypothetical protein AJ79_09032 [Helicocarpus griseus UAMH5409]|uniref:Cytochrome oxidase assembly protein 1 n=1 Tax=Helicocarpus griseus UAMH5409 TaxID=1447875 RepID=A0A2B7WNB6_9EURO|nr:hypothetical protein AJ79_09032 [Helicocarpus griseus UAMH5409]